MDDPIPEIFPDDRYHQDQLEKVNLEYQKLLHFTDEEKIAFGIKQKAENTKSNLESLKKAEIEDLRLNKMKKEVVAWNPPTSDHEGLKDFMLNQLDISGGNIIFYQDYYDKSVNKSPLEYFVSTLESLKSSIKYHEKHIVKEKEWNIKRNKWMADLRKSLE